MTTVLADLRLGVIVADTGAGDGDRQWPNSRKVWRSRGALLAFAGLYDEIAQFLAWWRAGQPRPAPRFAASKALVIDNGHLWLYDSSAMPQMVESGREAIGTGAKAALAAYEALDWSNPRRAVQIACKYDASSRGPVRTYYV